MKPQPSSNLNYVPQFPLNPPSSDQIQKCLDDNKNLILAIMECISLGKFTEIAQYLENFQQNLTYLFAMLEAESVQRSASTPQQESDHVPKLPPFLLNTHQSYDQSLQNLTYLTTMTDAQSMKRSATTPQASVLKLQQDSDHVPKLPSFLLNTPQSHDQSLQNLTFLTTMADAQSVQRSATTPQASVLKLQKESDHVPKLPPFLLNTPQSHDQSLQQLQQFQSQLGFRSATKSGMHQFMRPGLSSYGGLDIQGNKKTGPSDGSWKPGRGGGGGGGDRK